MFFEVMFFIFGLIAQFVGMLFTIMLSPVMSLGMFMCILFILVPIIVAFFCMLKDQGIAEFTHDFRERMHARRYYKGKHSGGKHRIRGYNPKHAAGFRVEPESEESK